ncbi:MAG: phosphate acyltransferase PlsX [Candidatus Marinimicrobia bacterium]|nr:phosphate acyltransferase PlsX [Candidatus Neomarinimicrobiota bacterium]
MRIAIDANGGDYAPEEIVMGAILAAREYDKDTQMILIGDKNAIEGVLSKVDADYPKFEIIHAPDIIEMSDSPTKVLKMKPNSAVSIGTNLQKAGEIDAFVSAGNTGVFYASTLMSLGRIKGVRRPTIGTYLPSENHGTTIFDVGANPNCRPIHLLQFAIMGSIYVEHIHGWENPSVGLLSIGHEPTKGNELTIETHSFFKENLPNFYGNVEGKDILKGEVDVVICDGFVGNIILKFAESIIEILKTKSEFYLKNKPFAKLGALMMMPAFKELRADLDYQSYGGVPLLGANGISIIGHGHSSRVAIKNAIRVARKMVKEKINEHIAEKIYELNLERSEVTRENV